MRAIIRVAALVAAAWVLVAAVSEKGGETEDAVAQRDAAIVDSTLGRGDLLDSWTLRGRVAGAARAARRSVRLQRSRARRSNRLARRALRRSRRKNRRRNRRNRRDRRGRSRRNAFNAAVPPRVRFGGTGRSAKLLRAVARAQRRRAESLARHRLAYMRNLRRAPRVVFSKVVSAKAAARTKTTFVCPKPTGVQSVDHGRRHAMLYAMGSSGYRTCLAKNSEPGFLQVGEGAGESRSKHRISASVRRAIATEDRKLKQLMTEEHRSSRVRADVDQAAKEIGSIARKGVKPRLPGEIPRVLFNADTDACAKRQVAKFRSLYSGDPAYVKCVGAIRSMQSLKAPVQVLLQEESESSESIDDDDSSQGDVGDDVDGQDDDDSDDDDDTIDNNDQDNEEDDAVVASGGGSSPGSEQEPDVLITTTKGKGYCWACHWARVRAAQARARASRARAARVRAARLRAARLRAARARAVRLRAARARAARLEKIAAARRAKQRARRRADQIRSVIDGATRAAGPIKRARVRTTGGVRLASGAAQCRRKPEHTATNQGFAHGASDAILLRRCIVAAAARSVRYVKKVARETADIRVEARNPLLGDVPSASRATQEKALRAMARIKAESDFQSLIGQAQRAYLGGRSGRPVDLERIHAERGDESDAGSRGYGKWNRAGEKQVWLAEGGEVEDEGESATNANNNDNNNANDNDNIDDGIDHLTVGTPDDKENSHGSAPAGLIDDLSAPAGDQVGDPSLPGA